MQNDEYVKSIVDDIKWLGYSWAKDPIPYHSYLPSIEPSTTGFSVDGADTDGVRYASDYFDGFFKSACILIEQGDAYVCSLPQEKVCSLNSFLFECSLFTQCFMI